MFTSQCGTMVGLFCVGLTVMAWAAEPVREILGIHYGSAKPSVHVARDRKAWEELKKSLGKPQDIPRTAARLRNLDELDEVDFEKEMIVAIFWGEHSFSGHDEKCWIHDVSVKEGELHVDGRAHLWGGAVKRAYRAWPFHVKVVAKSNLPVRFSQKTKWLDKPDQAEVTTTLGVIKPEA